MASSNHSKKKNKKPKQKKITVKDALKQAETFNDVPEEDNDGDAPVVLQETELSETTRIREGVFRLKLKTGPSNTGHAAVRRFALKRLAIDYTECQEDPLPMIAAEPLEHNFLEWHANIVGPPGSSYEDCCFHFVIRVPDDYPAAAPKVKLQSYLSHPNVFGKWICLDLLEGQWIPDDRKTQKKDDVGYGWSPAYSIQTILVQLQAFLFDAADTGYWSRRAEELGYTSTVSRARVDSRTFKCTGCPHRGYRPWPEPLCWKDRLRFMVPASEMRDVEKSRQELARLLFQVNSAITLNKWPKCRPLKSGSFFTWMLLPRWKYSLYDYDETDAKDAEDAKKANSGFTKMNKRHSKIIRALVGGTQKFMYSTPRPPPLKGSFVERMYRLESALELAVDSSYNSQSAERERGFWEWKVTPDLLRTEGDEDEKETADGKAPERDENRATVTDEEGNEWCQFPPRISDELEALFLRRKADRKRPNELVRYRSGKKTKMGVICKVPWWRRNEKPNQQGKVLIMPIDEMKTTQNVIWWWHNGPLMDIGKRTYGRYIRERHDGRRNESYYKESIIVDRFYNKKTRRWYIVIHPLPGRKDKSKAGWFSPEDIEPIREGRVYKSYVRGDDAQHYEIDVVEGYCRRIEGRTSTEIRRVTRNLSTQELWAHICRLVQTDGSENTPWKKPTRPPIVPFGLIDFTQYMGRCAWVDWAVRKPDTPVTNEEDFEDDGKQNDATEIDLMETDPRFATEDQNRMFIDYDETFYLASEHTCELPRREKELELDEMVHGIVKSIGRNGAWVDVGLEHDLFLELSQCRMSLSTRRKRLRDVHQAIERIESRIAESEDLLKESRRRHRKKKQAAAAAARAANGESNAATEPKKKKRNRRRRRGGGGGGNADGSQNAPPPAVTEEPEEPSRKKKKKKKNQSNGNQQQQQQGNRSGNQNQNQNQSGKKKRKKKRTIEEEGPQAPPEPEEFYEEEIDWKAVEREIESDTQRLSRMSSRKEVTRMSECPLRVNDHVELWVYDVDVPTPQEITLTQYRPIHTLKVGDVFYGYVRGVTQYAVFVDFGCSEDGYLHKTLLEAGSSNKLVFDCHGAVKIGDVIRIRITFLDLARNRVEIGLDDTETAPDRLVMPDDVNETAAVFGTIFGLMPDDVTELAFQFLDRGDLHRTRDVCKLFQRIIDDRTNLRWEIEELKCFHTKQTFRDEVLGMGVVVTRYPKSDMLQDIEPRLCFVSARSYMDYGNRVSAWKELFTNWLPVYINKEHGRRSMPFAKQQMAKIISREPRDWNPAYAIEIIPTLMNTMVVRVMKGELHESIVALEGYTMFYHLLLAFVTEYPALQSKIDRNIASFLEGEHNRNKKKVPSLGKWIALLAASNAYTWRDVATSYLRENFDRNVKWILMQFFPLSDYDTPRTKRLRQSFLATQVSLKLCMFHVCFLRLFRYSPRSGLLQSVRETKEKLDGLYGRPTHNMREALQRHTKRIKGIKTYKEFFRGVGVETPSDNELFEWLLEAMTNSGRRGYHNLRYLRPKPKKGKNVDQGDKYDQIADAFEGGALTIQIKKKIPVGDQMMNEF